MDAAFPHDPRFRGEYVLPDLNSPPAAPAAPPAPAAPAPPPSSRALKRFETLCRKPFRLGYPGVVCLFAAAQTPREIRVQAVLDALSAGTGNASELADFFGPEGPDGRSRLTEAGMTAARATREVYGRRVAAGGCRSPAWLEDLYADM